MNKSKYGFKQAFNFSFKEIWLFILTSAVSAFFIRFGLWDADNIVGGFISLITYAFLFAIIYFIFIAAQKYIAAIQGYSCTYSQWRYGPFIAFVVTVFIYGFIPVSLQNAMAKQDLSFFLLYLGTVVMQEIPTLKLGEHRHAVHSKDMMWVGIAGPLALLLMIVLVWQPLWFATQAKIFEIAIYISAIIIFFSSLPLPNTNGLNVLYYSRKVWLIYFVISLILMLLVKPLNLYGYVIVLIVVVILVWLYSRLLDAVY